MKVEQTEGFKPIIITLESRGELAILLTSLAKTNFSIRQEYMNLHYGENINEDYNETGYDLFQKLEQIFKATKP